MALGLTVSDGHGDKQHDLSKYGSRFAVRSAMNELRSNLRGNAQSTSIIHDLRRDFPVQVTRNWRSKIRQYHSQKEVVSDNLAAQQIVFRRYGATLLSALVMGEGVFLAQLGDGDILWLDDNGEMERPIAADTNIANSTDSLCMSDAHLRWRTAQLRSSNGVLVLASDGLSNSFPDDDELHRFLRSLLDRIREYGLSAVAESLPSWLDHYSKNGSGDDITLVMTAIVNPAADASSEENEPNYTTESNHAVNG